MLTRSHQIALLDESTGRVLVVRDQGGFRLPTLPERWPDVRDLVAAVGAPDARLAAPPFREEDGTITNLLLGRGTTTLPGEWRALDSLHDVSISATAVAGIARALGEVRDGPPEDGRPPWFRPGWLDDVLAWVDGLAGELGLVRIGEPEAVKIWSLSAVLRLPVRRGGVDQDLWFKATCDGFRAEPALTGAIRRLAPDFTPHLLALDAGRAWMLMEPLAGAADGAPPERAPDVARRLARLQLETLGGAAELAAAGAPDRGMARTLEMLHVVTHESVERHLMTEEQAATARDLEPWLAERVRRAWSHGLPDVLAHGDLHLGNVAWVDGRGVAFDWTDACLTHPFFDAWHLADSAAEESDGPEAAAAARAAVREAFLEPWRAACPGVDVDAAWEDARVAEAVFQAITFEQIYRAQPEASRWELASIVVEILDKLAEVRAAELPPA